MDNLPVFKLDALVPKDGQSVDEYKQSVESIKVQIPEGKLGRKTYPRYVSTLVKAAEVIAFVWEKFQLDSSHIRGANPPGDEDEAKASVAALSGIVQVMNERIGTEQVQLSGRKLEKQRAIESIKEKLQEFSGAPVELPDGYQPNINKNQILKQLHSIQQRVDNQSDFADMPDEEYNAAKTKIELIEAEMRAVKRSMDNVAKCAATRPIIKSFNNLYNDFSNEVNMLTNKRINRR